ncbi:MAG: thiamine-phosphate kinase [Legionella sp.]|nr:thiamine-phosphate kinase [Legionella sp.]
MNEFSLIDVFFKTGALTRDDVVFGIGDDAACLQVPSGTQLLVSTDTLVADVHFLSEWDAYDIAWKAVMVNVSDIAAMAATPCWLSLALTLPEFNHHWLTRFSEGLHAALQRFNISLIGGDTTRGPLSLTLTIHGLVPANKAVRRSGAKPGDTIWVSGEIGGAAQAVSFLKNDSFDATDMSVLLDKLLHPNPRVDLSSILQRYATAAIDISDGLSADLNHICEASGVGASLSLSAIPIHPLVKKYQQDQAVNFALCGGDDYELCFTVPDYHDKQFLDELKRAGLLCYPIGVIEDKPGLRLSTDKGQCIAFMPGGYSHF